MFSRLIARRLGPLAVRASVPSTLASASALLQVRCTPAPFALLPVVAMRGLAAKKKGKDKGGGKAKKSRTTLRGDEGDDSDGSSTGEPKLDIEAVKQQMNRPFDHLQREYAGMQTGRATPALLDSVQIDAGDGELVPLPSLAKVLAQGPQTLQVSCYDARAIPAAVKAIENAPLGLRAEQQGKVVRVSVPRPTQESRQALAKHVKVLAEAAKTAVRGVRQRAMKTAKSESSKEEAKRAEKTVEDATQAVIASVDAAMKAKEKEVLTV
jgi:ribosome recycling factor